MFQLHQKLVLCVILLFFPCTGLVDLLMSNVYLTIHKMLSKVQNVQVSDTTGDATRTKSRSTKIFLKKLFYTNAIIGESFTFYLICVINIPAVKNYRLPHICNNSFPIRQAKLRPLRNENNCICAFRCFYCILTQ